MEDFTPSQVIQELNRIRVEAAKGADALYQAEVKLAKAEETYEVTLQRTFINSEGTVADRTAISRLTASKARFEADLAKAEHNRIKTKLKQLELAQMSVQTISKQVELGFKFA
jgi:alkyl sulfatase BDS1-like metallo-beta-lactamase superfamily hydrolase